MPPNISDSQKAVQPEDKLPYENPKIVYEGEMEVFASVFCAKVDSDECALAGPIQS